MSYYTSLTVNNPDLASSKDEPYNQQGDKGAALGSIIAKETTETNKSDSISVALALLINVSIISILAAVVFIPFELTAFGLLSSRTKSVYVTGLTVLGTIFAAFGSSRIRHLWLRNIDAELSTPSKDVLTINTEWRTALGVASMLEALRRWHITLSFLISGLITTAIVAGLSSTIAEKKRDYTYYLADSEDYHCKFTTDSGTTPPSVFNWQLPNGSVVSVFPNLDWCPGSISMSLLGAINTVDPQNYGYADDGVAVHESALGAPASIYASSTDTEFNSEAFNSVFEVYGQNLRSTLQCVPVMTKNPITCSVSGNASYVDPYLEMRSADGTCANSVLAGSNLTWLDAPTVGALCTNGSLGQATIVFGGINAGSTYLAEAIGDSTWLDWLDSVWTDAPSLATYGITCTVDIAPALEWRSVQLTLQQNANSSSAAYSRTLTAISNEPCTPSDTESSQSLNKLAALAAAATYQITSIPWTTWARPLTILHASGSTHTNYVRRAPYAFSNSANALEDVLALTTALVLSRVPLTGGSGQAEYVGSMVVQYTRAGTGELWALVYVLPSLGVVLIIGTLGWSVKGRRRGASSEQLMDLMSLRME